MMNGKDVRDSDDSNCEAVVAVMNRDVAYLSLVAERWGDAWSASDVLGTALEFLYPCIVLSSEDHLAFNCLCPLNLFRQDGSR